MHLQVPAVTRAKNLLIVVGNHEVWSKKPGLKNYLNQDILPDIESFINAQTQVEGQVVFDLGSSLDIVDLM